MIIYVIISIGAMIGKLVYYYNFILQQPIQPFAVACEELNVIRYVLRYFFCSCSDPFQSHIM